MDKRTEFVEKLSAQIVDWDAQIYRLKERAECATPEAKYDFANAIAVLQLKRDEAAVKLQGISAAGDVEWEELKAGAELVWGEISAILHDAVTKIK